MEITRARYICVMLALVLPAVFAFGQPSPDLTVSGPITVLVSSDIPVGSYQVTISYDNALVSLNSANVSGGTGAGFTGQPITVNPDNAAGKVVINHFQIGNSPTGTFSVAVLNFTPIAAGTCTLTLQVDALTNTNGDELARPPASVSLSPSSITITEGKKRHGQVTSN